MCALNESALDRHFESQLRVMGDIYTLNISKSDQLISQRWLELFQLVRNKHDKYARNCLMLLMYSQLREMGRLGKPFTELENIRRNLDDVLSEYDGQMDDIDEAGEMETNASGYGGDSSRVDSTDYECCVRLCAGESDRSLPATYSTAPVPPEAALSELTDEQNEDFKNRSQANQKLLREIDSLHTRTLENEIKYKETELSLQNRVAHHSVDLSKERSDALSLMVGRSIATALERLKRWTGADDHMDFLCTCLQHVLHDKPELRTQVMTLDRQFETTLDAMLEQACERRQMNVSKLYEQLFKEQKEHLLQREQKLEEQQQQLQLRVTELYQREELLWQHEARVQEYLEQQQRGLQTKYEQRPAGGNCTTIGCKHGQSQHPNCYARQHQQQCNSTAQANNGHNGAQYQPVGKQQQAQFSTTNDNGYASCHQRNFNGTPPPAKSVVQHKQEFYETRTSCGECQSQSKKKIIAEEYRETSRSTW